MKIILMLIGSLTLLWFLLIKQDKTSKEMPTENILNIVNESKEELTIENKISTNKNSTNPINNKYIEENLSKKLIIKILEEERDLVKTYTKESLDEKNERIRLQMIEEQEIMLSEYGLE